MTSLSRTVLWLVALTVAALAAALVFLNDRGEINEQHDDLELFLLATAEGWTEATEEFFRTPPAIAHLVESNVDRTGTTSLAQLLDGVQLDDDVDAVYVGYPDGSFEFAARADPGGFRTRSITITTTGTRTELEWFDDDLNSTLTSVELNDGYDPRERPWYTPIAAGEFSSWSAPYTFASSGQPGISYSRAIRDRDGALRGVVGIDVRLTALDEFLSQFRPGPNGLAAVYGRDRQLISVAPGGDIPTDVDRLLVPSGDSISVFELDDDRTVASRRLGPGGTWTLVAVAENDDFVTAEDRPLMLAARALLAAGFAGLLAIALLRPLADWVKGLQREATSDALTGLPNRAAISAELDKALGGSAPVVVAIADLDGFKPVNDTWGHQLGDEALRSAALRIQAVADDHGLHAGRLGGDEFLVFGTGDAVARSDEAWADLVRRITPPFMIDGTRIRVGVSVGVAHSEQVEDPSFESLLRHADRALYTVKRNGGGTWMRLDHAATSSEWWSEAAPIDLRPEDTTDFTSGSK